MPCCHHDPDLDKWLENGWEGGWIPANLDPALVNLHAHIFQLHGTGLIPTGRFDWNLCKMSDWQVDKYFDDTVRSKQMVDGIKSCDITDHKAKFGTFDQRSWSSTDKHRLLELICDRVPLDPLN